MGYELELTKLRERLEGCLKIIKDNAKIEGVTFDKELFLQACKLAESLYIRSEIAYSGKKA